MWRTERKLAVQKGIIKLEEKIFFFLNKNEAFFNTDFLQLNTDPKKNSNFFNQEETSEKRKSILFFSVTPKI